jgi:arylsulfatase A-like enzyme
LRLDKRLRFKGRPNIIIIVLDAGRRDYLGCYGFPDELSPCIDRLAQRGILFENVTTVAPWTVPSHASMFTGLYPNQHLANWNTLHIREGIPTIFDILRANDYRVAAFVANDTLIYPCRFFGEQADIYGLCRYGHSRELSGFVDGFSAEDSNCDKITGFFFQWLKKGVRAPFILYFNYYDLHSKYDARQPYRSRYISSGDERVLAEIGDRFNLHFREMNRETVVTQDQIRALRSLYKAKMAMIDENIGKVVDALDRDGLLENSIIIITSDHGDTLGDHTHPSFHHQFSIYNALTRIPLIIYSPLLESYAKRVPVPLIQNIDIFPTILELCRVDSSLHLNVSAAVSLTKYIFKDFQKMPRRYAISMYEAPKKFVDWNKKFVNPAYIRKLLAIQNERYKLIFSDDERIELYDIIDDPREQKDIKDKFPKMCKRLKARFFQVLERYGGIRQDYAVGTFSAQEEEIIKQRLKSLGYIQ